MAEYIEREAALALLKDDREVCADSKEELKYIREDIRSIPAADVRPVVRCKDCVYWQKPQVWQNDGTFRDYEPGEYEKGSIFGGVSLEVGVNYGSFCALYNKNHENEIPQFMGENDFCSKGYKREES